MPRSVGFVDDRGWLSRQHRLCVCHEVASSSNLFTSFDGNEVLLKISSEVDIGQISSPRQRNRPPISFFTLRHDTTAMSLLSSMITLPTSSSKGLYSCWNNTYPRVASPTSSNGLSPPVSPSGSPRPSSLMVTIPTGLTSGFCPSRQHYTEVASPTGSGSLSPPPMSRPTSPIRLRSISEVFDQRASWPVSSLSISDQQNSDRESDSRPTSISTSVSYSYTVRSVNSRKSRLIRKICPT